MFAVYGLLGLVLMIFSFMINIFNLPTPFQNYIFVFGFWLFFDALDFRLTGTSILHKIKKKNMLFFYLVLGGFLIGSFIEFYGTHIYSFWGKQPISLLHIRSIFFTYGIPILMYYSIYKVVLTSIKGKFGKIKKKIREKSYEAKVFEYIGAASIVLLLMPFVLYPFFDLKIGTLFNAFLFLLNMIGLWFLFEYIEYKKHERSLLKDVFEGKWYQVFALIIGAFITGFAWEALNLLRPIWFYKNLIFPEATIFGVHVALLFGWIFLFILYLSFFRIASGKKEEIW